MHSYTGLKVQKRQVEFFLSRFSSLRDFCAFLLLKERKRKKGNVGKTHDDKTNKQKMLRGLKSVGTEILKDFEF